MSVTVHIPTPLRPFVGGRATLQTAPGTVAEVLTRLADEHGSLGVHLFGDDGHMRSYVGVYVGDRNVRDLDGGATPVSDGGDISIVPSIAGGMRRGDALTGQGRLP